MSKSLLTAFQGCGGSAAPLCVTYWHNLNVVVLARTASADPVAALGAVGR